VEIRMMKRYGGPALRAFAHPTEGLRGNERKDIARKAAQPEQRRDRDYPITIRIDVALGRVLINAQIGSPLSGVIRTLT
jgi:hypothetical protein